MAEPSESFLGNGKSPPLRASSRSDLLSTIQIKNSLIQQKTGGGGGFLFLVRGSGFAGMELSPHNRGKLVLFLVRAVQLALGPP